MSQEVGQLDSLIDKAAELVSNCSKMVVLTGAGASKESGIPTFRDALTGLWANHNPEDLATPEGFKSNPSLVWQWYDQRRSKLLEVEPNPGHHAIVQLEQFFEQLPVITQNVDGLHQRAGSTDVIELHGSIASYFCFDSHHPAKDVAYGLKEPPNCELCQSVLRPAVVWFGEALPHKALNRAYMECESADLVLVVGTSGIVQPAASLPFAGKRNGAKLLEVNPDETPITDECDIFLQGPGGKVLPRLIEAIKKYR